MNRNFNELTETVNLPSDVAIAVATGRSELLTLAVRPMNEKEVSAILHAMKVLQDTNRLHQKRLEAFLHRIDSLDVIAKGLTREGNKLRALIGATVQQIEDME